MTTETFHAVDFMRRRREQIDAEDAGLTWQERSARTIKALESDPLWQRLRDRMPAGELEKLGVK